MNFFRTFSQTAAVARRTFSTFSQSTTSSNSLANTFHLFNAKPQLTQVNAAPAFQPVDKQALIDKIDDIISLELMNRNKRKLKKANHGARPCNSRGRKARRVRRHLYA